MPSMETSVARGLTPSVWEPVWGEVLLRSIRDGKCTPFLGAGACHPTLPLGSDIASQWAKKFVYPMRDETELARVAQFMAVQGEESFPKELIRDLIKERGIPNFDDEKEPHRVLAVIVVTED